MSRTYRLSGRSHPVTSLTVFRRDAPVLTLMRSDVSWDDFVVTVQGGILCIDQAVAKLGLAYLECSPGAEVPVEVVWTDMIRTPVMPGNEGTLQRAGHIYSALSERIEEILLAREPLLIAHEMPPVSRPGAQMQRPESSLVAATVIRCIGVQYDIPVVSISAQTAKKRLTGNGNADKSLVKEAVRVLLPEVDDLKPRNEDTFDAIALGIVASEGKR